MERDFYFWFWLTCHHRLLREIMLLCFITVLCIFVTVKDQFITKNSKLVGYVFHAFHLPSVLFILLIAVCKTIGMSLCFFKVYFSYILLHPILFFIKKFKINLNY